MAIQIITGFFSSSREQLDKRSGPYASTTAALAALGTYDRAIGLPIYVIENGTTDEAGNYTDGDLTAYHFETGIEDADLVRIQYGTEDPTLEGNFVRNNTSDTYTWVAMDDAMVYSTSITGTVAMQEDVGGIPAGTTASDLDQDKISTILDALLFKAVDAYISESAGLEISGIDNTVVEVGTSYSFDATLTYDPGTISNGDDTVAGDVTGDALTFALTLPDASSDYTNSSVVSNTDTHTTTAYTLTEGTNVWTLSGTNTAGTTTYTDSNGNSQTITSIETAKAVVVPTNVSLSKTAYYPVITGMNATDGSAGGTTFYDLTLTHELESATTKVVSLTGTDSYIYFAYPSSAGALASIVDNNGFDVTASFTQYTVDVTSTGQDTDWTEEYYIYRSVSVTTVATSNYTFNF